MAGNTLLGLCMAGVAVVFFGSNFVPVKKYSTGDGAFFTLMMCCGIWVVGLTVWFIRNPTEHVFEPWACFGGVLWCCGNLWVVPIVRAMGLGLPLVLWGGTNLLMGWATGRFGWFGLESQKVSHPTMNSIGVAVAVIGLVLFMLVKPEEQQPVSSSHSKTKSSDYRSLPEEDDRALSDFPGALAPESEPRQMKDSTDTSFVDNFSPTGKRVFGVTMSLLSGVLYGSNFTPPQYVEDHRSDKQFILGSTLAPGNSIDYVFPHFCGLFMTSILFFFAYCAYMRNTPQIHAEICLPGFLSGVMWGIAQCSWFVANQNLSFPVSFPLVTTGPGMVGALWGVFVFKEVKGTRNFATLAAAFTVSIAASVIIAMSH